MTSLKYWNGTSWETIVQGASGATGGTAFGDASQIVSGQLAVANGGTGATSAAAAAANLQLITRSDFMNSRYGSSTAYDVIPRQFVNSQTAWGTTGVNTGLNVRVTMFTPYKDLTVNQLTSLCTTGASDSNTAGTVRRMGLFAVQNTAATSFACIARTPNDVNLWTATSTVYTKSLEASFGSTNSSGQVTLTAGVTYAFGCMAYNSLGTAFVAPSLAVYGNSMATVANAQVLMQLDPVMASSASSVVDFTGTTQSFATATANMVWGRLGLV